MFLRKAGFSHEATQSVFYQLQNGNIIDGLELWKNNIDKKFEGVDDCMICFSVLHGTNFQLPRITCKTCKKKFHSACLVSKCMLIYLCRDGALIKNYDGSLRDMKTIICFSIL